MKKVYIVAAKRSAIGSFLGTLSKTTAADFGAQVLKNIVDHSGIDTHVIDEVIIGHVLSAGQKQGLARQVSLNAGLDAKIPAYSVDMVCGSGMKAVADGYSHIASGLAEVVIAGGIESMSHAPHLITGHRNGVKMGESLMYDHMVYDALTDAFTNQHMGLITEPLAETFNISRQMQDDFAYDSQIKARIANDKGDFKAEITPIYIKDKKESIVFETDEYINYKTTQEKIASLKPAFKIDGTITAANASGINDGASFMILASEEAVKKYQLKPMAEIMCFAQSGIAPEHMGLAPVDSIDKVLKQSGLSITDLDAIEINESFALQVLAVTKQLAQKYEINESEILSKLNLKGGAIALGHPVGASGNRILVTLAHILKENTNFSYGLASLCIGGGMSTSMIIKKCE